MTPYDDIASLPQFRSLYAMPKTALAVGDNTDILPPIEQVARIWNTLDNEDFSHLEAMTPLLASGGIDLTLADFIAGSAFCVALIIGSLGVFLRYRAATVAGGLVAFSVAIFLLFSTGPQAENFRSEMATAIFVLVVALALLCFKRREKR